MTRHCASCLLACRRLVLGARVYITSLESLTFRAASVRARMAGDDAHSNDTINTSSGSDTARRSVERLGRISSTRDRSQSPSRPRPFTQNTSLTTSDGVFGQRAQSQAEEPPASASATGSGLVQQSDASAASGLDLFAGFSGTINLSQTQTAQQTPFTQSFSRTTTTLQGTSSNQIVFVNQSGSPNDQSHGTLVISHTGRSKYLGPSAASEWLKDVSRVYQAPMYPITDSSARGRRLARDSGRLATCFPRPCWSYSDSPS